MNSLHPTCAGPVWNTVGGDLTGTQELLMYLYRRRSRGAGRSVARPKQKLGGGGGRAPHVLVLKNSVRRGTQTLTDVFDITHDIDGFLPSNVSLERTINLVPWDFPIFVGKSPGDEVKAP